MQDISKGTNVKGYGKEKYLKIYKRQSSIRVLKFYSSTRPSKQVPEYLLPSLIFIFGIYGLLAMLNMFVRQGSPDLDLIFWISDQG